MNLGTTTVRPAPGGDVVVQGQQIMHFGAVTRGAGTSVVGRVVDPNTSTPFHWAVMQNLVRTDARAAQGDSGSVVVTMC